MFYFFYFFIMFSTTMGYYTSNYNNYRPTHICSQYPDRKWKAGCEHNCIRDNPRNYMSYHCTCNDGYVLMSDRHRCKKICIQDDENPLEKPADFSNWSPKDSYYPPQNICKCGDNQNCKFGLTYCISIAFLQY
jgi:hypothetical protein